MRRRFLVSLVALTLFTPCLGRAKPPNILFIFTDDHACQAIGAYGSSINRTPHIDRIAREGATFLNSFCTNSICGPSRACVLTGKHSHLNGVLANGRRPFDGSQFTFPQALQTAGYETALIGKWHLQSAPTGFDHWEVLSGQGAYYNPVFKTPQGKRRMEGYCTTITTDLALKWLQGRETQKPFLLMCQHKAPHRTWAPELKHLDRYVDEDIPEPSTLFDDWTGRSPVLANRPIKVDNMTGRSDARGRLARAASNNIVS